MSIGALDASKAYGRVASIGNTLGKAAGGGEIGDGENSVKMSSGDDAAPLLTDRWGALKVDANQMTSVAGVFAGGDSVRGPSLVVHAVRDGRRAARGIHHYLEEHAVVKP